MVQDGLLPPESPIDIAISGSAGPLGADIASPLAVALTELLQNAVEHAFPEGKPGRISIELARSDGHAQVIVYDDGVGMPAQPSETSRLGLQIVRSLIDELGGRFSIASDSGTRVEVSVPVTR